MADAAGGPPRLEYPAEGRATITLARPAQLNRLHREDLHVLQAHCATLAADARLRVVVLQAEGRLFCAGFNLDELGGGGSAAADDPRLFEQTVDALEALPVPTIARLHGGVYGGATDLALACDFRLGVKGMRFFMPAARFGLHYYPSGLRRYTQKVSPSFAKRAFLLSEDFHDTELLAVGYLDWLVERAEFKDKVAEKAVRLAGLAPLSMSGMKRAIEQFAQAAPDMPSIRQTQRACANSDDLKEGLIALGERRTPTFKGR